MPALTPVGLADPLADDPGIASNDVLVRYIRTDIQITFDHAIGAYILSAQSFKAKGRGTSVELERLYSGAVSVATKCEAEPQPFGAVTTQASLFRQSFVKDAKGRDTTTAFGVCYTPEQPDGTVNDVHCDVFPSVSPSVNRAWNQKVNFAVPLNQQRIAEAKAKRRAALGLSQD